MDKKGKKDKGSKDKGGKDKGGKDKGGKGKKGKTKAPEEEKGKEGKLKTCNFVKARHILCSKHSRALEAHSKLQEEFGDSPPAPEFGKMATEYSECSSAKKGGDLGWFPRGKMAGPFQEIAFALPPGQMSGLVKTDFGYHVILVEGRKAKL